MYTNGSFPFNSETTGPRGLGRAQTNSVTPSLKIWIHNLDLVPLLAQGSPQRFLNFILLSSDSTTDGALACYWGKGKDLAVSSTRHL